VKSRVPFLVILLFAPLKGTLLDSLNVFFIFTFLKWAFTNKLKIIFTKKSGYHTFSTPILEIGTAGLKADQQLGIFGFV
jgi:hypothetical protein